MTKYIWLVVYTLKYTTILIAGEKYNLVARLNTLRKTI